MCCVIYQEKRFPQLMVLDNENPKTTAFASGKGIILHHSMLADESVRERAWMRRRNSLLQAHFQDEESTPTVNGIRSFRMI